jgi:hypothetical protein
MTKRGLEFLHRLVIALYPRHFRDEFEVEMESVMHDLLEDPEMPRWRVFTGVVGDLMNRLGDALRIGVLFGLFVVLIWLTNRSIDLGPYDPNVMIGLTLIALLFAGAGFAGTRRLHSLRGGIVVGFVAGIVSSATVPGDAILFGTYIDPRREPVSFFMTMTIAAAVVMLFAAFGALAADFGGLSTRARRAGHAFIDAWRRDPQLTL